MNTLWIALQSLPPLILVLLKASLMLAAIQLLVGALPRLSAASKHLLLVAGITGFLLFPVFSAALPSWNMAVLPEARAAAMLPEEQQFLSDAPQPDGEIISVSARRVADAPSSLQANQGIGEVRSEINWMVISLYAWMTVALLLFSRFFLGLLRVWWIIRTGEEVSSALQALAEQSRQKMDLTRDVRLLHSDYVSVPMICGLVRRPTVLLPSTTKEWPEDQLRVVLLHEFAHLKRWDALTLLLTNAVTALFWFHPQVWFASLSARRECERACDDLVLNSGTRPSDYAGHLLSVVRVMPEIERFGAVTLSMSQRSQLEGRLLAILHPSLRRGSMNGRKVALGMVVAALLIAPLATIRLTAAQGIPDPGTPSGADGGFFSSTSMAPHEPRLRLAFQQASERAQTDPNDSIEDPDDGEQWFGRAYELHHSDRYDEAIAHFRKAAELGYRPATSMYNIACGYSRKNDRDNALAWLQRALDQGFSSYDHLFEDNDLDPLRSDPRFQVLLARYRDKDKDDDHDEDEEDPLEDARSAFQSLQRRGSTDGDEWSEAGRELLMTRQLDDAIVALNRAAELLGYRSQTATYNLACAYALRGDSTAALQTLERAILEGFDDADKVRNDPDLESLHGTPRYRQLVQLADDLALYRPEMKEFKRDSQYSRRRWAPAVRHFESYLQSHPTIGRAWFNLGFALHYSSEHQRAMDAFQRSLNLGYRRPTSMYNVACGYAKLGQVDSALTWLEHSEKAGFDLADYLLSDDDLESLRTDARFLALATRIGVDHVKEKIREKIREKKKRNST